MAHDLAQTLRSTRALSLALLADLDDAQWMGPQLRIVNPPCWEFGHVAYFYEYWGLRCARGEEGLRQDADSLYDSIAILHDDRWDLPLPTRAETLAYAEAIQGRILELLESGTSTAQERYLVRYALFHEQMHTEAFMYTRQTLSYPPPTVLPPAASDVAGPLPGDVQVPGGTYVLGARRDQPFAFDNEKWGHEIELAPFSIARAPVSQGAFAAFVDDGGYSRREFWDDAGWSWREAQEATQPVYWRRADGTWQRRTFDRWVPLEPHRAMVHVCWHEAQAWCRWAGRRLPSEAEWELAASGYEKRTYPWGEAAPTSAHANLGGSARGCVDVAACDQGESPFGCRQMIGNVWEWTSDLFGPYPGFRPDMYREYSQMLFGTTRVLRGGCWVTQPALIRNTWRNYYGPDRRDVWAGFRTCAQTA